jgi:hypothetical protein
VLAGCLRSLMLAPPAGVPARKPRDKGQEVTGPAAAGDPLAAAERADGDASGSSTSTGRSASSGSSGGSGATSGTSTSRTCSQSGGMACCHAQGGGGGGASDDSEGLSAAPRPSPTAPAAPAPLLDVTAHPVRLEQLGASLRAAAAQLSEPALAAVEQQVRGGMQDEALAGCLSERRGGLMLVGCTREHACRPGTQPRSLPAAAASVRQHRASQRSGPAAGGPAAGGLDRGAAPTGVRAPGRGRLRRGSRAVLHPGGWVLLAGWVGLPEVAPSSRALAMPGCPRPP